MDLVSAIIPTYNRFKYLLNTIQSIKAQTYKNIEIIAVNDCSTEKEYYEYNWEENGVTMIHLDRNSKLEHTGSVFVKDVCIYYDAGHGDGQDY